MTCAEDAIAAAEMGADALGFVFYDKSPRAVTAEQARSIIEQLPPFVSTVALFVNEQRSTIQEICDYCAIDWIQLHGDEEPTDCVYPGYRVLRALRIKNRNSLKMIADYPELPLLLDAWSPGCYGGTGDIFNWELAADVSRNRPILLAGGLSPYNVADAVRQVRPWGVDVSSGVESTPGIKDHEKIAAFIEKVHLADLDAEKSAHFSQE